MVAVCWQQGVRENLPLLTSRSRPPTLRRSSPVDGGTGLPTTGKETVLDARRANALLEVGVPRPYWRSVFLLKNPCK